MIRLHATILFFSLSVAGWAERFSLDSAASFAIKHNPELAAARFNIEEARGRLLQSGRRANPEFESEIKPNVRGREYSIGIGFVQRFPLTNRLRLEKAVSQADLTAAEAEVRAGELKLAASIRALGVKWLTLQENMALKARQVSNSKELAEVASKTAAAAEGSSVEAAQLQLEARQLSMEILQLEAEKATLEGEARSLLGMGSGTVDFVGSLPNPSVPGTASPNLDSRPDYQAAQARIESAQRALDLAKANKWEDVGVGIGAEVERSEDAPEGLETDGFVGLRFSLPLPFWNKNEGKIKEAEASAAKAEHEANALRLAVKAEALAAIGEMKAARRILDETDGELLPLARSLEEKLATYYKQSQPDTKLADVLRSRDKRLAIEQARLDALRAYHLARVRFESAMGR
jgi:outer membrane protein TolC